MSRVTALEQRLDRRKRLRDEDDMKVIGAVMQVVEARRFSSRQLRDYARVDSELRHALQRADCVSGRSIGRLLARVENRDLGDGLALRRVGTQGGSLLWQVMVVSGVCVTTPPTAPRS